MMKGRNLRDDKKAMLTLKYMAIAGVSTKKMVEELHEAYGHRWSTSTVVRNVSSSPVPTKTRRNKLIVETRSVASYFKGVKERDLTFGDLCEYTASFFEEIATNSKKPKGERKNRMSREWWRNLESMIDVWHDRLLYEIDVRGDVSTIPTERQKMAYKLCLAIYRELKREDKSDFRTRIFPMYYEWRETLLSSKA